MAGIIKRNGYIFEAEKRADGMVRLSYLGQEGDFKQFVLWLCDDEAEAKDMIEAVITPGRYAEDEYRERHRADFMSHCKW